MPITNQAARNLLDKVRAYLERADQSVRGILPVERDLGDRCPGVDPTGMYSGMEALFRQRRDVIAVCAAGKEQDVRSYVDSLFQTGRGPEAERSIREISRELREVQLARDLCQDEEGRRELDARLQELNSHPDVELYGAMLQEAEFCLGLGNPPTQQQQRDLHMAGITVSESKRNMSRVRNELSQGPLQVLFPDLEHITAQRSRALRLDSESGEIVEDTLPRDLEQDGTLLEGYVEAAVRRALSPYGDLLGQGIPLEERIIIDGKTGKELLDEARVGEELDALPDEIQALRHRELCKRVGAALMDDPPGQVELFQEKTPRKLAAQPLVLTRTGYQPREPYHMSLWQRFCHFFFGAYREEAERERQSKAQEAARSRLLKSFPDRAAEDSVELKNLRIRYQEPYQQIVDMEDRALAESMCLNIAVFGKHYNPNYPYPVRPDNRKYGTRVTPTALAVGMLLAQGHSIEDILDPAKLAAEKKAVGDALKAHVGADDGAWYARNMKTCYEHMARALEEKLGAVDLTDEQALLNIYPQVNMLSNTIGDLSQEMEHVPELAELIGGRDKLQPMIDESAMLARQGRIVTEDLFGNKRKLYEAALGLNSDCPISDVPQTLRRLMLTDGARHKLNYLLHQGISLRDAMVTQPDIMDTTLSEGALSDNQELEGILAPLEEETPQAEKARCNMAIIALKGDYQALKMETPIRAYLGTPDPALMGYRPELKIIKRQETPEEYRFRRKHAEEINAIKDGLDGYQLGREALERDLFGDTPARELKPGNSSFDLSRTMPLHLCMGILLKDHPIEDILDPNKLRQEKRQVGAEVSRRLVDGDVKWVAEEMINALNRGARELNGRLERERDGGLMQDGNLARKTNSLYGLGRLCHDLGQEVTRKGWEETGIREHLKTVMTDEELNRSVEAAHGLCHITDGLYTMLQGKAEIFDIAMGTHPKARAQGAMGGPLSNYYRGTLVRDKIARRLAEGKAMYELISTDEFFCSQQAFGDHPTYKKISESVDHFDPQANRQIRAAVNKALLEGTLPVIEDSEIDLEKQICQVTIPQGTELEKQLKALVREGDIRLGTLSEKILFDQAKKDMELSREEKPVSLGQKVDRYLEEKYEIVRPSSPEDAEDLAMERLKGERLELKKGNVEERIRQRSNSISTPPKKDPGGRKR